MSSRYVITKKPIEDYDLEDARSADLVLDESPDGPAKAKCRHVMQGFSEPSLLELETSTPQVHGDSVVVTVQVLASMGWQPGCEDFTQAFHSGDSIGREIYATQPRTTLEVAENLLRTHRWTFGLV